MKPSPTAPSRANKPARVPSPDRAPPRPRTPEAPPSVTSPTPSASFLRTSVGIRAWHRAARDSLFDLAAAAHEGARRSRKRVLSRAEIRRQACAAFTEVASLLDLAAASLEAAAARSAEVTS